VKLSWLERKIVFFGIESANQRILDYYEKRITPEETKRTIENARKAGIDVVSGSFIVGAPSETKEEIENTLKSIHFWSDSTGIDPSKFLSAWERINKLLIQLDILTPVIKYGWSKLILL
jgi:radical SAM superfamily enzyme YgiQ (UPF0313 family)